ncbi:hypothetical protein UlMin_008067 [Ulmus minor]
MVPSRMSDTWANLGSSIASFMFVWAIICQYSPHELRHIIDKCKQRIKEFFDPYLHVVIHQFTGGERMKRSEAYALVEAYLSANTTNDASRLKAEMETDGANLVLSLDDHQKVTDEFQGVTVWWALKRFISPNRSIHYDEQGRRYYKLTFHKRHREIVTKLYLDHVIREGKEIRMRNRQRKLYTNYCSYGSYSKSSSGMWSHIMFEHPASFETMAMDSEKKKEIVDDLLSFSRNKDFYARAGKAWKRGYLLYGPPGTGKSTMVAAMANLLNYDIYDLELTAVKDNTELRRLLIDTTCKSIIVIEDIDCSLDLTGQRKKKVEKVPLEDEIGKCKIEKKEPKEDVNSSVTLSGLLNFIDGLWSACGSERLIVFTTNYVEKLDPALIRRGRMDKHIELSYCSFEGFKVLAKNYLKVEEHEMFDKIESLMGETKITPADVGENLMPRSPQDAPEKCLSNLIQALEEVKEKERVAAEKKAEEIKEIEHLEEVKEKEARVATEKKEGEIKEIEQAKEEAVQAHGS